MLLKKGRKDMEIMGGVEKIREDPASTDIAPIAPPATGTAQSNAGAENIIKNHLELIVLSMLCEKPLCGYDLIKNIFAEYNVLLSQGTVYPLLYSLREEGIVRTEFLRGNMRTKMYSTTREGKQIIEKRINDFIKVEESILDSIKKR